MAHPRTPRGRGGRDLNLPATLIVVPEIEIFQDELLQPAPFSFPLRLTIVDRLRSSRHGSTVLLGSFVKETLLRITWNTFLRIHAQR